MRPTNINDTLFWKALVSAQYTIWRFFLTVCFVLLVYLLNQTNEAVETMATFDCAGLLVAGTIVTAACFAVDKLGKDAPTLSWGEIIGYVGGLAASWVVLKINESTLQQIGTTNATAFIFDFTAVYFAIAIIRVICLFMWEIPSIRNAKIYAPSPKQPKHAAQVINPSVFITNNDSATPCELAEPQKESKENVNEDHL